jgi:isopenicillin N synthase-like dioxygenase
VVDVPADPYAFVVNIGDMLERMTRGGYRSNPHRVRNLQRRRPLSFPLFLDPSWDATVTPLPQSAFRTCRSTTPRTAGTGRACTPGRASTATT